MLVGDEEHSTAKSSTVVIEIVPTPFSYHIDYFLLCIQYNVMPDIYALKITVNKFLSCSSFHLAALFLAVP